MYDFVPSPARSVIALSGPLSDPSEWDSLTLALGSRGTAEGVSARRDWHAAIAGASGPVHLAASGTAAHDALATAMTLPARVRSVTLVDPDMAGAIEELTVSPQFRRDAIHRVAVSVAVAAGDLADAAQAEVDRWMGRGAYRAASLRFRRDMARRMPRLVADWRRQGLMSLSVARLAALAPPVRVVLGARAPVEARQMAGLLRMVVPDLARIVVPVARGLAHLSDPHMVWPDVANFVAAAQPKWQSSNDFATAA